MSERLPVPPAHIAPYVAALGVERAIAFLLRWGGGPAYLAERPQAGSEIVAVIGEDGLRALQARIGGGRIDRVPRCGEWVAQVMAARGVAVVEIARRLHTTDVTVRRWIKRTRWSTDAPKPTQLHLF